MDLNIEKFDLIGRITPDIGNYPVFAIDCENDSSVIKADFLEKSPFNALFSDDEGGVCLHEPRRSVRKKLIQKLN